MDLSAAKILRKKQKRGSVVILLYAMSTSLNIDNGRAEEPSLILLQLLSLCKWKHDMKAVYGDLQDWQKRDRWSSIWQRQSAPDIQLLVLERICNLLFLIMDQLGVVFRGHVEHSGHRGCHEGCIQSSAAPSLTVNHIHEGWLWDADQW